MIRPALLLSLAVALLGWTQAAAQPPSVPATRNFDRPAPFPQSDAVEIHRTIFAIDRETSVPPEATTPPEARPVQVSTEVEVDGEFGPARGEFTRYRYLAARGARGFAVQSLEWGNDYSSAWWEDCRAEGSTRLRASLGFGIHWWEGPRTEQPEAGPDLPARVYDLYLDLLWQEHWSDHLMTDVLLKPGLFTDFKTTPPQAFRLRGHAIALFAVAHGVQLVGGVDCINRDDVKVLPVAGVLWRADDDTRLHLVFPEPRASHRLGTWKGKEYWGFVAGEYGGGAWTYKDRTESHDRVEYSDYRVVVGFDICECGDVWPTTRFELGYAFHREIRLGRQAPDFDPMDTFFFGLRCNR